MFHNFQSSEENVWGKYFRKQTCLINKIVSDFVFPYFFLVCNPSLTTTWVISTSTANEVFRYIRKLIIYVWNQSHIPLTFYFISSLSLSLVFGLSTTPRLSFLISLLYIASVSFLDFHDRLSFFFWLTILESNTLLYVEPRLNDLSWLLKREAVGDF